MELNVHVLCKYICNKVGLIVKGLHMQVWIGIYRDHVFIIETYELWCMNVFGYVEEVLLLFKELSCNLYILELWSTLTFCTRCVLLFCYDILRIWFITGPHHDVRVRVYNFLWFSGYILEISLWLSKCQVFSLCLLSTLVFP